MSQEPAQKAEEKTKSPPKNNENSMTGKPIKESPASNDSKKEHDSQEAESIKQQENSGKGPATKKNDKKKSNSGVRAKAGIGHMDEETEATEEEQEEKEVEEEEQEEKEETKEELAKRLQAKIAEKEDKYMRLLAEFENFKRRSIQEMQSRFKYASQPLALNIITGLDNLERAINQAKEEENEQLKEFVTGLEMVQQQFYEAFEKCDIERTSPIGEPFDPNKHEAVTVLETDEVEPDHIAEVFQASYVLHDRVIRPARVQVAKKK